MSDQTPGQGHDGSASKSSSPPQLSSTLLAEDSHTPDAFEGDVDPKTVENIAEADGGGYGGEDEDEEAQQEEKDNDEEYDDFNVNELPERPASRHDFSSDDEGVMVKFQQRRKRFSRSPALSNISEDSNETTGSPNASRRAGRQLATGHGLRDNEQEEDNLADVLDTRGRLFDRIFVRLREESLYTNPQALMAAVVMGTMLGEEAAHWWSADNLENRFTSHIEDFRQANAQPRDDGTMLPLEMQNQITEQLQGLAYILQGDAERWHAQGLSNDTDYIMQITESIDNLLEGRPRTAPTSRAPSTGSNGSGPERVLPLLDRQALRRRGREHLIDIIIQQDDNRRADMDQFEADIEVATTQANAGRDDAKAELRLLTAHTQQLREIAHENGLNNRDLEGRPLHMERTPAVSRRDEQDGPDEYIDRLESELDECNKARDKGLESLRHSKLEIADLKLEIADLTANLDSAREEARQALEQRDRIHTDYVNTEDRESVNEMSGQELPAAPVSEASTRGQEPPPTPTSHVSTDQGITTDRQSSYGTDVDLEALRREHQQEVAQLRADHAKEISELRQDFEDDRRRAQGSRPQNLMVDGEFLPSQETSNRSISSQATERRESSENDFVTGAIPGLEKLLVSLWDDDDESADFIAGVEQSHQQEHPNQVEPEHTSDLALASPAGEDSHRESGERPASARVTNEKGDLETKILELTKAHSTLQRDKNTQKQIREGNTARIRQLEGQSMALQDALQKEMLRNEALKKQLAMPERDSTDSQRDLEANRKIKRQQGIDLERIRSILASRGSEQQSGLRSGPPPHGTSGVSIQAGPPTGHASNASTTSSFNSQERGQLLNLAAQVANQHAREHTGGPLDEAQKLALAGQAADLYLRRLMGEQSKPNNDDEDGKERNGETQPSVTKNGEDVENGSAGGGRNGRSDHDQPLYIDPTWLSLHPNGACHQCVPVLRFPTAIFPGSSDPGPCRCGPANRVGPHIAESRSSHGSGSRSVAFSDENGANNHDVPEGCATTKFPRSILKKPRFIDTARAKPPTRDALPRSPYPKRTRSLPDWNAAQLPTPRQTQRSQSASSTRSRSSSSLPSRQLSHDVSVPIIPIQKSCCEHFDELKRVCACNGRCFKTCECQGTCEDHLPVIPKPLRQHFRDVAAVVEAGTSPADLIADLYYPSGTMFPRQEGQPYDWNQVVQANADLLRSHDLLGSNGEILVPRNVPASGPRQRVDLASAVAMQGSLAPDDKEGGRARSQASQDDLVSLATSTAPSAPPGAHQAALRSASGFQRGARDGGMSTEMRDDALPHFPQPNPGRLLPDSLLEFHGPQPDFDNDEDEDSTRSTRHALVVPMQFVAATAAAVEMAIMC
ncbi:hypothetical protein N0V93_009265 [Gnomoniopsis smithogilvyi]|uniref:Uncharacterized protein n=1 Tax=Gnomoniopsis smithogilvyi TaxID=1191159 RepID=A0A9W8YJC6_9PEZI|nr:hypothetical protein N0V93_009265 [Gnomoniopsis smithogilvyi]